MKTENSTLKPDDHVLEIHNGRIDIRAIFGDVDRALQDLLAQKLKELKDDETSS